jgi:hypothetical protein
MSKFKTGKDGLHIARLTVETEDFSNVNKILEFITNEKMKTVDQTFEVFDMNYMQHNSYYPVDDGTSSSCDDCDEKMANIQHPHPPDVDCSDYNYGECTTDDF